MPINVIVVGILTFMSRMNFVLNCVELENSFLTSMPDNLDTCFTIFTAITSAQINEPRHVISNKVVF